MRHRMIIDCDPGIDDALALSLALRSPEVGLDAVTVVAGNADIKWGVRNALRVLDLAGGDTVPVFVGADRPLERSYVPANNFHGKDGLGDCGWPDSTRGADSDTATDVIIQQGHRYGSETTLVCTGPLTNLALAIKKDPEAIAKYRRIVAVGGTHRVTGDASPAAETNFWIDPEAAQLVVDSHIPVALIGWDIGRQVVLTPNHRELLRQMDSDLTTWIARSTRVFLNAHWARNRILGCSLPAATAVAAAILPQLFAFERYPASVAVDGLNRGQLLLDPLADPDATSRGVVSWCTEAKIPDLMAHMLARWGPESWTDREVRRCLLVCRSE